MGNTSLSLFPSLYIYLSERLKSQVRSWYQEMSHMEQQYGYGGGQRIERVSEKSNKQMAQLASLHCRSLLAKMTPHRSISSHRQRTPQAYKQSAARFRICRVRVNGAPGIPHGMYRYKGVVKQSALRLTHLPFSPPSLHPPTWHQS